MISIRENVFESNSSSMHCLTVCANPGKDVVKKYVVEQLQRWKNGDGTYEINITLDEELLDKCDFTIRRYVPHESIQDKLMYIFATIIQHYNNRIFKGPVKPSATFLEFSEEKYKKDLKTWQKAGYHKSNQKWLDLFEKHIKELEESLAYSFHRYLFEKEKYDENNPKVRVKLNYYIDKSSDTIFGSPVEEKRYFSTGCYDNEEFYYAVCNMFWKSPEWICNPFSQVLAGSDEQDDEDSMNQVSKAKELLEESWKLNKKTYSEKSEHDLVLNPGKVIWPIGG